MTRYFISTVRYEKLMENGLTKTVNEQYLIDALSFTEAETRTIQWLSHFISGDFVVSQIVKPRITEVFFDQYGDRFYKVKASFIVYDEKTGIEKRSANHYLVQADTFDEANRWFVERMKGTVADYEIQSIAETAIVDYFPAKA